MIVMQKNRRRTILKTILWGIVGIVIGVAVKGFLLGLGTIPQATSEGSPSWIKVTVIAGILVGAMLVLIFFLEKRGVYRHESRANPEDRLPAS